MHRRRNFLKENLNENSQKITEMIISVFTQIKYATFLFLAKPN